MSNYLTRTSKTLICSVVASSNHLFAHCEGVERLLIVGICY